MEEEVCYRILTSVSHLSFYIGGLLYLSLHKYHRGHLPVMLMFNTRFIYFGPGPVELTELRRPRAFGHRISHVFLCKLPNWYKSTFWTIYDLSYLINSDLNNNIPLSSNSFVSKDREIFKLLTHSLPLIFKVPIYLIFFIPTRFIRFFEFFQIK